MRSPSCARRTALRADLAHTPTCRRCRCARSPALLKEEGFRIGVSDLLRGAGADRAEDRACPGDFSKWNNPISPTLRQVLDCSSEAISESCASSVSAWSARMPRSTSKRLPQFIGSITNEKACGTSRVSVRCAGALLLPSLNVVSKRWPRKRPLRFGTAQPPASTTRASSNPGVLPCARSTAAKSRSFFFLSWPKANNTVNQNTNQKRISML